MALRSSSNEPLENAMFIRCEDMQEIVKWTQVIVHEIFREKTPYDVKTFDGDWWKAVFGKVPVLEATVKVSRSSSSRKGGRAKLNSPSAVTSLNSNGHIDGHGQPAVDAVLTTEPANAKNSLTETARNAGVESSPRSPVVDFSVYKSVHPTSSPDKDTAAAIVGRKHPNHGSSTDRKNFDSDEDGEEGDEGVNESTTNSVADSRSNSRATTPIKSLVDMSESNEYEAKDKYSAIHVVEALENQSLEPQVKFCSEVLKKAEDLLTSYSQDAGRRTDPFRESNASIQSVRSSRTLAEDFNSNFGEIENERQDHLPRKNEHDDLAGKDRAVLSGSFGNNIAQAGVRIKNAMQGTLPHSTHPYHGDAAADRAGAFVPRRRVVNKLKKKNKTV
jgi:hypothetical protein